jgi:hypothetical protein
MVKIFTIEMFEIGRLRENLELQIVHQEWGKMGFENGQANPLQRVAVLGKNPRHALVGLSPLLVHVSRLPRGRFCQGGTVGIGFNGNVNASDFCNLVASCTGAPGLGAKRFWQHRGRLVIDRGRHSRISSGRGNPSPAIFPNTES